MLNFSGWRLWFSGFENLGCFLIFLNILIHGFECGSKLGDVEGLSLECGVGAKFCVCKPGGCRTSSTLWAGSGVMIISWCWIFLFWLFGSIGGNGKNFKRGWDVLPCKLWAILLIDILLNIHRTRKGVSSGCL